MKNKIVKLTNAVYNLLEYFPETDPLKNKAKEKALAIMENLSLVFLDEGWVSLKDYFSGNREKAKLQTLEDIGILLNCLKLAKLQGWLDSVNFLIVSNEYEKIIKLAQNPPLADIEASPPLSRLPARNAAIIAAAGGKASLGGEQIKTRQKKILQFLQQNQKAQVMDLMSVLPDVTKRTIRRDLDELLKMGKVVREGEFNQVLYKIS